MNYLYILLNLFLISSNAFSLNQVYKYNYKDTNIKLYSSQNNKNTKNIVFYSGGNSVIPPEIYNNFLKTLGTSNYNIYCALNNKEKNEELLDDLEDSENETILMAHSSGCINAIEEANNNKFIKKLILLDPVNNKDLFKINLPLFSNNKKNKLQLKYINEILLLTAEKSYEWSFFPEFNMPFIPAFAFKESDIKNLNSNLNLNVVKAPEYGHSDILDSMYSDFMHKTISKGSENRSEESMFTYFNWLKDQIDEFINPNELLPVIINIDE